MTDLGLVAERRGDLDTALRWWQRAAELGDVVAINNVGASHARLGDLAAAASWFERAAAQGDVLAMFNLGTLADDRDDEAEAESWWRTAADSGSTDAMVQLGMMLDRQGRTAEAHSWRVDAAEVAWRQFRDDDRLRDERLRLGETMRQWHARVNDARETSSMANLAMLLLMSGRTDEAVPLLLRAEERGDEQSRQILQGLEQSGLLPSDQ